MSSKGSLVSRVTSLAYADAILSIIDQGGGNYANGRLLLSDLNPFLHGFINVKQYGAKGDVQEVYDAAITTGTNALSSASGAFVAADVGKIIVVAGAGTAAVRLLTNADYNRGEFFTQARTRQAADHAGTGHQTWNESVASYQKVLNSNAGGILENVLTVDGDAVT